MIAIEPGRTALCVMDFQNDIVAMLGDAAAPVVERTAGLIAAARAAQIPIFYVVVGFRPGYPEANARNERFAAIAKTGRFQLTAPPGSDVVPALRPEHGDIIVIKHRVSAFAGTDLDMILRAKGIDTLVLSGISTSGVVLSTTRHAADADHRLVIVKDCCADPDDEVHRVLTEKVLARQAVVVVASEAAAAFSGAAAGA